MWSAWLSLKTYHKLPSLELEVTDSIAAYCLDKAVMWFGITVENLLDERVKVISGKDERWEQKYSLDLLLDPAFRLPRPLPIPKKPATPISPWEPFLAIAGKPRTGVRRWEYIGPQPAKAS